MTPCAKREDTKLLCFIVLLTPVGGLISVVANPSIYYVSIELRANTFPHIQLLVNIINLLKKPSTNLRKLADINIFDI